MNESRLKAIGLAFDMLDTNKSGTVELEVIKSKYNPQRHPAVLEGRKTEEQVREDFNDMLNSYTETYGIKGKMTKEDFVNMYSHVSFTIDKDDYFIVMLKNTWSLDATSYKVSVAPSEKSASEKSETVLKFNKESKDSPFKKTIAQEASENPIVKSVHEVPIEPPYYVNEDEKTSGNIYDEHMQNKTDALVLNRFRSAIFPRGVKGILHLERLFKIYGKNGMITFLDLKQTLDDFHILVDEKDLKVLFKALDTDGDEKIVYSELIHNVVGSMSGEREKIVDRSFAMIDTNSDGLITKEDVAKTLDGLKHPDVKQGRKTREDLLREFNELMDLCIEIHVTLKVIIESWIGWEVFQRRF